MLVTLPARRAVSRIYLNLTHGRRVQSATPSRSPSRSSCTNPLCTHGSRLSVSALGFRLHRWRGTACAGSSGEGAGALPPVEVKTITLEAKPVPRSTEYLATIQSLGSTTVQPQIEGLIRQILVRAGARVRAGTADRADRSRSAAGDGQRHRVAARGATGGPRARDAAAGAHAPAARGGRGQSRGPRRRPRRRTRTPRRSSPWCSRRFARASWSSSTTA